MLDTTISGMNSNSYVSVEEADAFFNLYPYKNEWDEIPNKESYLFKATMDIDSVKNYKYKKLNNQQSLKFPRTNHVDGNGNPFIPNEIKKAVFLQAYFSYLNEDDNIHQANKKNNITGFDFGKSRYSYNNNPYNSLYPQVEELLREFRQHFGRA